MVGNELRRIPAVLEVTSRATGPSMRLSDRKSSMEGLSSGRLSCCSPTSCWVKRGDITVNYTKWKDDGCRMIRASSYTTWIF